ncbi:MAG: RecX family transcriptional regulator [Sphingomonas sp.]|nr:RecX family transcriptional regulator [Sphingomonas sp.]
MVRENPPNRRVLSPLDHDALERLALRYVERFATTRARLIAYLDRKVRERGWQGAPADPGSLADRMVALGYVDDRAFASARAGAMARRGLGGRRISAALRAAGVGEDEGAALAPMIAQGALAAALRLAQRKRLGPYAVTAPDRAMRERQLAAMVRAGHSFELARRIISIAPGDDVALDVLISGEEDFCDISNP